MSLFQCLQWDETSDWNITIILPPLRFGFRKNKSFLDNAILPYLVIVSAFGSKKNWMRYFQTSEALVTMCWLMPLSLHWTVWASPAIFQPSSTTLFPKNCYLSGSILRTLHELFIGDCSKIVSSSWLSLPFTWHSSTRVSRAAARLNVFLGEKAGQSWPPTSDFISSVKTRQ
jgi:hypothetical protein